VTTLKTVRFATGERGDGKGQKKEVVPSRATVRAVEALEADRAARAPRSAAIREVLGASNGAPMDAAALRAIAIHPGLEVEDADLVPRPRMAFV
jgi:hypothetical protein